MVTIQVIKKIQILSGILTSILFIIVMFVVNPMIDGKIGLDVIKLQLSFHTDIGKSIIENWNEIGKQNFLKYIYTDYIYAFSYAIFLSSIYYTKLLKNKIHLKGTKVLILILPLIAGLFDMIENTIEIMFIKNSSEFPEYLFELHSILAFFKWLVLPFIFYFLIRSIKK